MDYESVEVEVTAELIGFISNDMNMDCERVDLFGRDYLKVYGDLSRFLWKWKSHRPNAPFLDVCNISSDGYWSCSVITNWDRLGPDMQRRIMSLN